MGETGRDQEGRPGRRGPVRRQIGSDGHNPDQQCGSGQHQRLTAAQVSPGSARVLPGIHRDGGEAMYEAWFSKACLPKVGTGFEIKTCAKSKPKAHGANLKARDAL
ncbi:hypothetical protein MPL3356_660006 [Mesorhizobium plurifarium]|uniref:Uncharacterized protein n=1 Tax=Mesorhizobium plurifarium TaxID=69974 RepID=A0A090EH18_MESPL|nr:hypothetical protein MPL3356_660006 [Mesorhizobium plurifarium]